MNSPEGDNTPILDLRDETAFEKCHRAGAVNIPLEQLAQRAHELAPRDVPVIVFDEHPTRARWAASRLRARGRCVAQTCCGAAWLSDGDTEQGPSRSRLWRPHALLEEAILKSHGLQAVRSTTTSHGLQALRSPTTSHGLQAVRLSTNQRAAVPKPRALDIACGSGRDAVFLAMHGFDVDAWDVLPDALERCNDLARRCGVIVRTACRDVEKDPTLPVDAYDLVACFNFLHRPLLSAMARAVRPGGLVVYETFVEPQRERFGKPGSASHVLKPGELAAAFSELKSVVYREGLSGPRRIAASLIARRRR